MQRLLSRRAQLTLTSLVLAVPLGTGCEKSSDKSATPPDATPAATPAAAPAVAVPTEPIAITPQALAAEFKSNSAAANAKYPRLTPFKITGVVAGFGSDVLKLKNEDKDEDLAVACTFADSEHDKTKNASRGDKFTVIGKLNGYVDGTVELLGCKVAE